MLINDSSISIEFTENKITVMWKFRKVTVYEVTYLNIEAITSVAELKQAIVNAWQELLQSFIDRSINEWRHRLECVVQQNGGHIEYLFK